MNLKKNQKTRNALNLEYKHFFMARNFCFFTNDLSIDRKKTETLFLYFPPAFFIISCCSSSLRKKQFFFFIYDSYILALFTRACNMRSFGFCIFKRVVHSFKEMQKFQNVPSEPLHALHWHLVEKQKNEKYFH